MIWTLSAITSLIEMYYPNTVFVALRLDVFDHLYSFKALHGYPTWEETLEQLLPAECNG